MISPIYRGNIEVVTTDALLIWDIQKNQLLINQADTETISISPRSGFQRNDFFMAHMKHFLSRISDKKMSEVASLKEGVTAINVVLTAYQSNLEGRRLPVSFINW
jgi:predicted dehydrogenase